MLLPQKMGSIARAILDPLPAFNFTIALIDVSSAAKAVATIATAAMETTVTGGFTECSGLESSMTPEEHKEGGSTTVLRFPQRHLCELEVLRPGGAVRPGREPNLTRQQRRVLLRM